jgi:hypothetical protein
MRTLTRPNESRPSVIIRLIKESCHFKCLQCDVTTRVKVATSGVRFPAEARYSSPPHTVQTGLTSHLHPEHRVSCPYAFMAWWCLIIPLNGAKMAFLTFNFATLSSAWASGSVVLTYLSTGTSPLCLPFRIRAYHETFMFCTLNSSVAQWYSTFFFVSVPPDVISFQLCTPKIGAPKTNVLTSGSPVANPKSGLHYSRNIHIFFLNLHTPHGVFAHPLKVKDHCCR